MTENPGASDETRLAPQNDIKIRVDEVERIWELIQRGTNNLESHSNGFVKIGPELGNVGEAPELRFVNNKLTFRCGIVGPEGRKPYGNFPVNELAHNLGKLGFISKGVNTYPKESDPANDERIAYVDPSGNFIYQSSDRLTINDPLSLESNLQTAAALFKEYVGALYWAHGDNPTGDTLWVRPRELEEMEAVRRLSRDRGADSNVDNLILTERPNTSFEEIGGQAEAVATCRRFSEQLLFREVFELQGSVPPRGILLWGPPGTGKTMLAKAIASEADATFLHVRAGDVVGEGLYGQTEAVVTKLFSEARRIAGETNKQVIIFVDEADLVLPSQHSGAGNRHEATGKTVGIFAQEMDGMKSSERITLILATNDPNDIDLKILSRMEENTEVPLPDAAGLESIFKIHVLRVQTNGGSEIIDPRIDLIEIAKIAEQMKFSGRDVKDILNVLMRKRGEDQLMLIKKAIDEKRIPVPSEVDQTDVVKNVAARIRSGDVVGIEGLVLPRLTSDELLSAVKNSSKLLKTKKIPLKMGFVPN